MNYGHLVGFVRHRCFRACSLCLQWCAYGAPARLADSTSWISCFATTRWPAVTLDPGKKQMSNSFYYSLTRRSRVEVIPTRARNNDTWDRRRIVNNMR